MTTRLTPETFAAAELVAAASCRTVSGLIEYALRVYIESNFPEATKPGAKLGFVISDGSQLPRNL
jgi:hypothetical protein